MDTRGARPPSALEQITAEALPLAGGGRALLLQVAHPAVGRGVVEHSDFAGRALDRLHATMTFVYASVFATPEEFAEVRRHVNQAHAPVRGEAGPAGPRYSAFDQELQLWVAATLYETMVDVHERVFGPLDPAVADEVYAGFTRLGLTLQVPASAWPTDREAFRAYWDDAVASLTVGDGARGIAGQLLAGRNLPFPVRAVLPPMRLLTAGLLPPSVRDQYGFEWDDARRRRFDRGMRVAAAMYPRLPRAVRTAPRDLYLRRLRRPSGNRTSAPSGESV